MRTIFLACFTALILTGCASSGSSTPPSPEDAVQVRVVNGQGALISVSYSFARTPPAHLGSIQSGGEASFTFPWEPGTLEMVVRLNRGTVSSNRVSVQRGDRFLLDVSRNRADLRRVEEGGG
jgi:hypothetical protein